MRAIDVALPLLALEAAINPSDAEPSTATTSGDGKRPRFMDLLAENEKARKASEPQPPRPPAQAAACAQPPFVDAADIDGPKPPPASVINPELAGTPVSAARAFTRDIPAAATVEPTTGKVLALRTQGDSQLSSSAPIKPACESGEGKANSPAAIVIPAGMTAVAAAPASAPAAPLWIRPILSEAVVQQHTGAGTARLQVDIPKLGACECRVTVRGSNVEVHLSMSGPEQPSGPELSDLSASLRSLGLQVTEVVVQTSENDATNEEALEREAHQEENES